MVAKHYLLYADCGGPPRKSSYDFTQPKQESFSSVEGKVEFDLGKVVVPEGEAVRIRGEFSRIKPRKARDQLSDNDLQPLKEKLTAWIDQFFDRSNASQYWNNFFDVITMFAAYVNPFHCLDSFEMEIAAKTFLWFWYIDDMLEFAIIQRIPFKTIELGTNQFLCLLRGETRKFNDVPGCPEFEQCFNALLSICDAWSAHDTEFHNRSGPLTFFARRYLHAPKWYSIKKIDHSYSEETFVYWRRILAFSDGIAEVIYLLCKGCLPKKILKSPLLGRMLDICNGVGAFTNDLLGLRKEVENGEKDNFVVFKAFEKGMPLDQAVREVCEFVSNELKDFVLLRETILTEFSYDANLVEYIDILESLIDGHNFIYNKSVRHASSGTVTITNF